MTEVKLYPYSEEFIEIFKKEKAKIKKVFPEAEVHHIGSTAIPAVGGKGIIDILVALPDWEEKDKAIDKLKGLGFEHVHPEENGRIFLNKTGASKYKDTHIHLVEKANKEYKEKLLFRDFLRENKEEAKTYHQLKYKWEEEVKGDRDTYGKLKESYIEEVVKRAERK
jgi:GrpB-like predicted nucleotidyltransferase (UPF0157 family)